MGQIDLLAAAGMGSLGIFIGIVAGIYAWCAQADTGKYLGAILGAIGGAAVIAVFSFLTNGHLMRENFFYPIGLLFGLICGMILSKIMKWAE